MSQMSDSACLAVVRGSSSVSLQLDIEWRGCVESTFDAMCSQYMLAKWVSTHERMFVCAVRRVPPECFVYLAKATAFDGSFCIYKVGVSKTPKYRMQSHDRIPALRWNEPKVEACYSAGTARMAEAAILASAARAGYWIGGEWIAGCNSSRNSLAITAATMRKDCRYRVREKQVSLRSKEATDGR